MIRDEFRARLMTEQAGRAANEAIVRLWGILTEGGRALVRCECGDEACRAAVWLPDGFYEKVRADPSRFVVLPGHTASPDEVVELADGYAVIRGGPTVYAPE
jgi:hypothetical protein